MYNVVIVEDDPAQACALEDMVKKHPQGESFQITCIGDIDSLSQMASASSGGHSIDLLFMDICLPDDVNGIDVVRRLFPYASKTQVVYVSGYAEYCTKAYQSEHVYFLLKPVEQASLFDAIDKALANVESWESQPIGLSVGGNVVRVDPEQIEYIESVRRKIRVCVEGRDIEAYGSLAHMMEVLPKSFMQCHKSFIINIARVSELRSDELVMMSGARIPVSQKRRRVVKEELLRFLRSDL